MMERFVDGEVGGTDVEMDLGVNSVDLGPLVGTRRGFKTREKTL
jgi:hypothetical protein